jgi:hypothetical protein
MRETRKTLDEIIARMRTVGEQLTPYNYPQADPKLEDDLNIIKTKEFVVDGYEILIHFSRADHRAYVVETVQVLGKNTAFLPFCVVVKVARKFLGNHHLNLVEFFKDNRKIYCWTISLDHRGCPVPHQAEQVVPQKFEGFEYSYMPSSQIKFY